MKPGPKRDFLFCMRLYTIRTERGYSQEELAKKMGFNQSIISRFENGIGKPSFDNLWALADVLGVTIDYLVGRSDNKNP